MGDNLLEQRKSIVLITMNKITPAKKIRGYPDIDADQIGAVARNIQTGFVDQLTKGNRSVGAQPIGRIVGDAGLDVGQLRNDGAFTG